MPSSRGGTVVTGGKRHGNQGFFYEPTVVTEVPDDSKVMTEEPFGPIAPIVTFKTFDEVVERANSLPFGLAAYAFTTSNTTAAAIGDAIESGMVGVNSVAVSTPETLSAASRNPATAVKAASRGSAPISTPSSSRRCSRSRATSALYLPLKVL